MTRDDAWAPVSLEAAASLLDLSGGDASRTWAHDQLTGAVDLYARLGEHGIAWLCDEVGLGKTYVAMAVAALLRRQKPEARILYLLPSTRLLPKWSSELRQFSRDNVRHRDDLLRTLQGGPATPLVTVETLHEFARAATLDPDRDVLCTLGAFSFSLEASPTTWRASWKRLLTLLPPAQAEKLAWEALERQLPPREGAPSDSHHLDTEDADPRKRRVKVAVAAVINTILPDFDLVICDESHNLRHGLASEAARNRMLSVALGGVFSNVDTRELTLQDPFWATLAPLRRRARRVLMLTATPFQTEYGELARQAAVFGFTARAEAARPDDVPDVVARLERLATRASHADDAAYVAQRDLDVRPLLLRRIGTLTVGDQRLSRNQYREEYREGGMNQADPQARMEPPKPEERLLLALVQKRVLDVLEPKDGSAAWKFQMGLLSSFESFGQTLDAEDRKHPSHEGEFTEEGRSVLERETNAVDELMRSYQRTFTERMPHPKLKHVACALAHDAWHHGEKALVFVRRVRTTEELATRVTVAFDDLLSAWISEQLPQAQREAWRQCIDEFSTYRAAYRAPDHTASASSPRSLFGWYFRTHEGDTRQAASHAGEGGRFVRKALASKRTWGVLLEDNPVLVLFDHDAEALRRWATQPDRAAALMRAARAYARLEPNTGGVVKKRSPREVAWFHAYQAAALDLLADEDATRATLCHGLRSQKYAARPDPEDLQGSGFIAAWEPADWLALPTLFADLQRPCHADLCRAVWGVDARPALTPDTVWLRERDQRLAVSAQLLRTGRAFIDTWLAAVTAIGTLDLAEALPATNTPSAMTTRLSALSASLIARLRADRDAVSDVDAPRQPLTGYLELARAQHTFFQLRTLNFPRVSDLDASAARREIRTVLTGLEPAVALHGHSKTERALEQFRMPGFPVVMVATSVVQEGVDLHTWCRRVVHYGIDGSATGTEQRNGRVDRRGSWISRLIAAHPEERVEVFFPHLRETLEPLQMATLYRRINRFLLMANQLQPDALATSNEMLEVAAAQWTMGKAYPPPYRNLLATAFDVREIRDGGPLAPLRHPVVATPSTELGVDGWSGDAYLTVPVRDGGDHRWRASVRFAHARDQQVSLHWASGRDVGMRTLILASEVGVYEVEHVGEGKRSAATRALVRLAEVLTTWTAPPGMSLVCVTQGAGQRILVLRSEVPMSTGLPTGAVRAWICTVACTASALGSSLSVEHGGQASPDVHASTLLAPEIRAGVLPIRAALMPRGRALEALVPATTGANADDEGRRLLGLFAHNMHLRGVALHLTPTRLELCGDLVRVDAGVPASVRKARQDRVTRLAMAFRQRTQTPDARTEGEEVGQATMLGS